MKRSLLTLPVAFLAGIAASWLVRELVPDASQPRPAPAVEPRGEDEIRAEDAAGVAALSSSLQRIEAAVRRIDDRLRRLEAGDAAPGASTRRPAPGGQREPAGPEAGLAELATLVRELRSDLDARFERLAAVESRAERLERLRADHAETDWTAIWTLIADWNADEDRTAKELKLLADEDVLARFGTPTEIWSNEKGVHWIYGQGFDEATGKYATEVYLRFQDGYVTVVGVEP